MTVWCRVYNRSLELVQVSRGHTDVIRDIIHIPDKKQVISQEPLTSYSFTVPIQASLLVASLNTIPHQMFMIMPFASCIYVYMTISLFLSVRVLELGWDCESMEGLLLATYIQ